MRKLALAGQAVIMFTDLVGYSALSQKNEALALELLIKNRELHKSLIEKHYGKWLKKMGKGSVGHYKQAPICPVAKDVSLPH